MVPGHARLHRWNRRRSCALVRLPFNFVTFRELTLFLRVSAVVTFALVLAGVAQSVRYVLLKRAHRGHTVAAIHHDVVEQHNAHDPE